MTSLRSRAQPRAISMHARSFPTFLALGLLSGCSLVYSDDLSKKQCSEQSDCDSYARELGTPLVCRSSACQAPFCTDTASCPTGSTCVQNQCIAPRDAGVQGCTLDSECKAEERCGFDGLCYSKWGCLDQSPDWPKAPSSFRYRAPVINILAPNDPTAVGLLSVMACNGIDFKCETPRVPSASVTINYAPPTVLIDVPFTGITDSFTGFLRIDQVGTTSPDGGVTEAPDAGPAKMLPSLVHFTPDSPLVGDLFSQNRLLTISAGGIGVLAGVVKVDLDLTLGIAALQAYDCGGRQAEGVTIIPTISAMTTFVAVQNEQLPVVGTDRTGADGAGILINMPGGYQRFQIRDLNGDRLLSDSINFYVQTGAINYIYYYPRYAALKKWIDESKKRGLSQ